MYFSLSALAWRFHDGIFDRLSIARSSMDANVAYWQAVTVTEGGRERGRLAAKFSPPRIKGRDATNPTDSGQRRPKGGRERRTVTGPDC